MINLTKNCLLIGSVNNDDVVLFIKQDVYKFLESYASSNKNQELGAFFLGDYTKEGGKTSVVISDVVRAKYADVKANSLSFTRETFEDLHREQTGNYPDTKPVGWLHSNPGNGVGLTKSDLFLQENLFNRPYQVLYVIDPIKHSYVFYQWKNDKLERLKGFYVYDDEKTKITVAKPEVKTSAKKEKAPEKRPVETPVRAMETAPVKATEAAPTSVPVRTPERAAEKAAEIAPEKTEKTAKDETGKKTKLPKGYEPTDIIIGVLCAAVIALAVLTAAFYGKFRSQLSDNSALDMKIAEQDARIAELEGEVESIKATADAAMEQASTAAGALENAEITEEGTGVSSEDAATADSETEEDADSTDTASAPTGWKTYVVKDGESLFSICQNQGIDFSSNYQKIVEKNNMGSSYTLMVGDKILLPAE